MQGPGHLEDQLLPNAILQELLWIHLCTYVARRRKGRKEGGKEWKEREDRKKRNNQR